MTPRDLTEYWNYVELLKNGHRAFGRPQSWSADKRGLGGELLIADLLTYQVGTRPGGSVLFLGLDLGAPGSVYPHVKEDSRHEIRGFGGDIDIALFIREYRHDSERYGSSRRGLDQDHLVLIDSKQYSADWDRSEQFAKAEQKLRWFRHAFAHPALLGNGSDSGSLRMTYHFAHTGSWVPTAWLRRVGVNTNEQVEPNFEWWNTKEDLVFESPVEVLLGQLSVLLTFANPESREGATHAVFSLLSPDDRIPYSPSAPW